MKKISVLETSNKRIAKIPMTFVFEILTCMFSVDARSKLQNKVNLITITSISFYILLVFVTFLLLFQKFGDERNCGFLRV